MANPTYPGVYVEEVAGGVRPIEAVGTSTAAFVGLAERGPDDVTRRITSWTEYQRVYGGFIADGYLAESVFQFFNNGGGQCYVVRVTRGGANGAAAARVTVRNRAAAPTDGLELVARSKGAWGNAIVITVEDGTRDPDNELRLTLRHQDDARVIPDALAEQPALEIHDDLSMDPATPNFITTALAARSGLIDARVLPANVALNAGFLRGGADPALPLGDRRALLIELDGDGPQAIALPADLADERDLARVAIAIEGQVTTLRQQRASTSGDAFARFTCRVERDGQHSRLVLQSGSGGDPRSSVRVSAAPAGNAIALLHLREADGATTQDALATRRPPEIAALQLGDAGVEDPVTRADAGSDGTGTVAVAAFQTAFGLLDRTTDFSLLAVPGENSADLVDAGMGYCERRPLRDVFYIGEATRDVVTADGAATYAKSLNRRNSYGAVYFPWIKSPDLTGASSEPVLLPPSGFVAGLYARTDAARGVWKAPAGTGASLGGASGLAVELTDVEHGNLNPLGINVIRRFPTAGIVAFGARTITSDPEWKYVPVRRLAIMLRVSIYYGLQWAVFEPNDELLWSQLRRNVGTFMMNLFRQGAFQGAAPADAFFVKCDGETTTQGDVDLGVVNVLVGFAPLKPAEFVVVKVSQKAGQAA
jgi:phage tail sheath protein FI